MALADWQVEAARSAGIADRELTEETGNDHHLTDPRWIWTRVIGTTLEPASERELADLADEYEVGWLIDPSGGPFRPHPGSVR